MKNMQLTQWMPLKLSKLKKNSWDFQVGPAYGDLQHWAASGTKGQQSAMVHHWHQWSWPQTEESSHHTGGTQWPKCEHLLLNREKNKRNQYPQTETKSKDLGLFLGILKKTKQILDGYFSWQLDFLINHASIRDRQIHVVGIDTVLVHPTLVPTDCFHGATSGNVSHEDVVHPIHSNPPALLWCRVCHSRQTQSTIGQENMGVVADHIPTTPQQSRQGEHRSGPFAKVQPATSSSWQQWGPLKASLQKLTVGQLDLLVAACHLLSLRCWSFTDQRPLTCTLPDIGFQQSCLDHVQVVIAMLVEIRRLIPFWKQLSDFHPRPHHPFLLNQFDPLTDPHSQAWSIGHLLLNHQLDPPRSNPQTKDHLWLQQVSANELLMDKPKTFFTSWCQLKLSPGWMKNDCVKKNIVTYFSKGYLANNYFWRDQEYNRLLLLWQGALTRSHWCKSGTRGHSPSHCLCCQSPELSHW